MVIQAEQDRVKHLLSEALPMLCKSGLSFSSEFCIEALIGITLDKNDVFLVSIKETIKSDSGNEDSLEKTTDISITRVDDDTENLLTPRSHRKRRHSKSSRISDSESDNEVDEVTIKREKLSSMEQEDGSENSFETSTSSQRNYTTTGTQGTASVFVKQEPNMTDSINVEQAVENFNITGFTQDEGESNLGNQAIVKPVQSFSHDQAVSGLGRSAGMPPEIHAAEDTGQESDSINTTSATASRGRRRRKTPSTFIHQFEIQPPPSHPLDVYLNREEPGKIQCKICGKTASRISNIREHIRMVHIREKHHFCCRCGRGFYQKAMLKKHEVRCEKKGQLSLEQIVEVQDEPLHKVTRRKYSGRSTTSLQIIPKMTPPFPQHFIDNFIAVDEPGKLHCKICGKQGKRMNNLRYHIRLVHLRERNHMCCHCGRGFFQNCDRAKHESKCCGREVDVHSLEEMVTQSTTQDAYGFQVEEAESINKQTEET